MISNIAVSEGSLIYSSYQRLEVLFLESSAEIEAASVAHYARIGLTDWQRQGYLPDLTSRPLWRGELLLDLLALFKEHTAHLVSRIILKLWCRMGM